jgi:hypothetical protein
MADLRSPNRDFTLNTPGNRLKMTGTVGAAATTSTVPSVPSTYNPISTPRASTIAPQNGGTLSLPIMA